jgi:hypothetical protein
MAAGLGFKTFTTGEVLTAGDVNGYLMQGINVFTNATARDAAITAPAEGQFAFTKDNNSLWYYDGAAWIASGAAGDIEGVTAGVGISGGGTSGTVTITNSMATEIAAKGDLIAGTGSQTFDNLSVGANNTVLTADSSTSTGLKWATPAGGGGLTLINTGGTTLSGASVSISSIPGTYKSLTLIIRGYLPATDGAALNMRYNSDTNTRYNYLNGAADNSTFGQARLKIITDADNTAATTLGYVQIPDYANTTTWKICQFYAWGPNHTTPANANLTAAWGVYNQTAAITSIDLSPASGNFSGGTAFLYGEN